MATSETSGRSSPSRSRFTPTSTSNSPRRRSRRTRTRSSVTNLRVQVLDPHAEIAVVLGQVLGHALGQGRHQRALARRSALRADLRQQIVDLTVDRPHQHRRIEQPGRTHDLLDDGRPPASSSLVLAPGSPKRRSPGRAALRTPRTCSGRLSSAEGRRKPWSNQRFSLRLIGRRGTSRAPAGGHVGLVDDDQRVVGQVIHQRRRRVAGAAPGQVPRVVLDPVAVADLLHHLEVEAGSADGVAGPPAASPPLELRQPLLELLPDRLMARTSCSRGVT